mmetsp:Transcript_14307/g.32390  ORF Transcript_14307/g.32390 Transcript_14307/m.32390 type:complete len:333 (-) Transcript_14307:826-1824(-)
MPGQQRERNAIQVDRSAKDGYHRFALKLAWDGTTYKGFQSQSHMNTVQDNLEKRISGLIGRPARVIAWGRTDSGVHAQGAVCSIDVTAEELKSLAKRFRADVHEGQIEKRAAVIIQSALREFSCDNGNYPDSKTRYGSIAVKSVVSVDPGFDARFSAKWKRYIYYVIASEGDPTCFVWARYAWHVRWPLNLSKMIDATDALSGEHNFKWLSVTESGELRDPRRNLRLTIEEVPFQTAGGDAPYFMQQDNARLYRIIGTCDFFLYRMMRLIAGLVVHVGSSRVSIDAVQQCIRMHDSYDGGEGFQKPKIPSNMLCTAPAKGLCLDHIEYEKKI